MTVCIHVVLVLIREEALRRMLIKLPNVVLVGEGDSICLWLLLYSCLPVPCINQPKVHVTSEGCYVIVTGNIRVNRMTKQWECSNVKML